MDVWYLVLRLVHVVGGVFWVGSAAFLAFYVEPTARAMGPEGGRFLVRLGQTSLTTVISGVAGLVILAGLVLYWRDSGGLQIPLMLSGPGLAFGVGGLIALATYLYGFVVTRPTLTRMGRLGREIAAAGAPTPAQMAEINDLQRTAASAARLTAYGLLVAAAAMAVARYL